MRLFEEELYIISKEDKSTKEKNKISDEVQYKSALV